MMDFDRRVVEESPRLRRYALSLTRNTDAANDLVQDTLLRALTKRHLWQEGTDLRAWLFTLLHNMHVNNVRRMVRRGTEVDLEHIDTSYASKGNQEDALELDELAGFLEDLPDAQRRTIRLVGVEGLQYEEAAAIEDVPVGTIRSRLFRGRQALLAKMAGDEPAPPPRLLHQPQVRDDAPQILLPEPPTIVQVKLPILVVRRKLPEKLAVLERVAFKLRRGKKQPRPHELIAATAKELKMGYKGANTFYYRAISKEKEAELLYGPGGCKITRDEEKFAILMRIRRRMQGNKEPSPQKRQLAALAAGPLGMTINSAEAYLYEELTPDQVKALKFAQPLSLEKQIAILKRMRKKIHRQGLPPPRQKDLAEIAAPLIGRNVASTRSLIADLTPETRRELDFLGDRLKKLLGDTHTIPDAYKLAIDVLKNRHLPLTRAQVRKVLGIKQKEVDAFMEKNQEFQKILDEDYSST